LVSITRFLSYISVSETMIDLESIADPMERDATVGIIHNCEDIKCHFRVPPVSRVL
jgi:hypothetical protein